MKFSEILKKNNEFGKIVTGPDYIVSVLSNLTINQFKPILEFELRREGVKATVNNGDYDNILQNSAGITDSNLVIIFWEMANLVDGFQYRANVLTEEETRNYIERFKSEIDILFFNLASFPLVIINKFSTLIFNNYFIRTNNFDFICEELNEHLKTKINANIVLLDIDKIISRISIHNAVDFRNYYSSKALYSVDFFKEYAAVVKSVVMSVIGKAKKAIVFDCDNTLWNGIIGEDGMDGIRMSSAPDGVIFQEVQFLAKELSKNGILIGLNSKNNLADVDEVFQKHTGICIREEDIVVKKINWNDKVGNLREIASELNIGLDSIVFIDDSDFEINLMQQYLPEVKTLQVPKTKDQYPQEIRKIYNDFFNLVISEEDKKRIKMYREEVKRNKIKSSFENITNYLRSLQMKLFIYCDNEKFISRMSQLTQKTNQFNFTTKRYTGSEVSDFVYDNDYLVVAFAVKDKFGDFGLTGLIFAELRGEIAVIDTFLMSCRVLGRNIEYKFIDEVIKLLLQKGIKQIRASYIKTQKNTQLEHFFDNLGFPLVENNTEIKKYELLISDYKFHQIDYIDAYYER